MFTNTEMHMAVLGFPFPCVSFPWNVLARAVRVALYRSLAIEELDIKDAQLMIAAFNVLNSTVLDAWGAYHKSRTYIDQLEFLAQLNKLQAFVHAEQGQDLLHIRDAVCCECVHAVPAVHAQQIVKSESLFLKEYQ